MAVLSQRLAEPPHRLIALFGPRQTGKTTIVLQALQQISPACRRYLAVDEPDLPRFRIRGDRLAPSFPLTQVRDPDWLVRNWEQARLDAERAGRFVLVFDEIQKIPQWSETVKGLWDADRARNCPLHVVVLGSAPLLMQSGLNESLAGRFEPIHVTHWSFDEMSSAFGFDLPKYFYFGGYPGAVPYVRDPDRWRNYILGALVEPNIEKDLLAMTRVDKPALLKRLFELGAAYSGQILSYNKMLGQLQDAGNTTTLARYLDLLSNTGWSLGCQILQPTVSAQGVEPQAQCAQHGLDDRRLRVLVRPSQSGPHLLGSYRRERGRCPPVQHGAPGHERPLLAGESTRGRFRPAAWSSDHRH